jgi:hypothetical protein
MVVNWLMDLVNNEVSEWRAVARPRQDQGFSLIVPAGPSAGSYLVKIEKLSSDPSPPVKGE